MKPAILMNQLHSQCATYLYRLPLEGLHLLPEILICLNQKTRGQHSVREHHHDRKVIILLLLLLLLLQNRTYTMRMLHTCCYLLCVCF